VAAGQLGGHIPEAAGHRGVTRLASWLGDFRLAPLTEAWREIGPAGQVGGDGLNGRSRTDLGAVRGEPAESVVAYPGDDAGGVATDVGIRRARIGHVGAD